PSCGSPPVYNSLTLTGSSGAASSITWTRSDRQLRVTFTYTPAMGPTSASYSYSVEQLSDGGTAQLETGIYEVQNGSTLLLYPKQGVQTGLSISTSVDSSCAVTLHIKCDYHSDGGAYCGMRTDLVGDYTGTIG